MAHTLVALTLTTVAASVVVHGLSVTPLMSLYQRKLRRVKYLNNVIEQDHRFVKKKVRASQCFKSFHAAERTLEGVESLHMMRKGQVKRLAGSDAQGREKFVDSLFGVAV